MKRLIFLSIVLSCVARAEIVDDVVITATVRSLDRELLQVEGSDKRLFPLKRSEVKNKSIHVGVENELRVSPEYYAETFEQ